MNDLAQSDPSFRYYLALQTRWGRWWLNLHVQWERLLWHALVFGAQVSKRIFDMVISFVAIALLSPFLLLIMLLVRMDGGPAIFVQTRVGRFGREFKMYKYRSMCLDAEQRLKDVLAQNQHGQGITFKIKDDPRITRVGKWLRKFSLDELPQLFNVLKGDMSIVGPRPPLPREVLRYTLEDRRRLEVTPGITCIWQISGRANIDFSGQVLLDVRYIESQSFWTDLKIILRTFPAVLMSKGAC
jgi:lipopolysaccharide/colanic/teichoic acid biosynthesis glycosyltransferase